MAGHDCLVTWLVIVLWVLMLANVIHTYSHSWLNWFGLEVFVLFLCIHVLEVSVVAFANVSPASA